LLTESAAAQTFFEELVARISEAYYGKSSHGLPVLRFANTGYTFYDNEELLVLLKSLVPELPLQELAVS
jgi:hypothetical protein